MDQLAGQNICVYDLEIKNEIKGSIGWKDYDKMGISVGVIFDFRAMDFLVYLDDNIEEMTDRLNNADLVSGFNIISFDNPLVNATTQLQLHDNLPIYDLYQESCAAVGGRKKGMKLDDHLLGTFGPSSVKTESGADAPIFHQQGKIGRLISYCIADVKREARLFRHAWEGKAISTPTHGPRILRDPRLAMRSAQKEIAV